MRRTFAPRPLVRPLVAPLVAPLLVAVVSLAAPVVVEAAKPQKTVPVPKPPPTATTPPPASTTNAVEPVPRVLDDVSGANVVGAKTSPSTKTPPAKPATSAATTGGKADDAGTDDASGRRVDFAACPASSSFADVEPSALVSLLHKKCRNLHVPAGAAPTEIAGDDVLVALCVKNGEATDPAECGLKGYIDVPQGDEPPLHLTFAPDGELALTLRTARLEKAAQPHNGTTFTLVVEDRTRAARSPLVWRKSQEPYGHGTFFWFPMPMLTTDFSSSPAGYRLGVTPVAVAIGTRFFPSATSRNFLGASVFGAWNLLVPNDVQTLTNSTSVRINYKAFGGGLLVDASGYVAVGVGLGHTFTSDGRTDVRVWLYFGPKLLSLGSDW